ncbi:MAG: ATP-binding cassette domain-containing protein [Xanthomonadaceae bacterium]|nr:ATP-binding cassette domain-containing protein [Xanthomonadaceae bacterium]
MSNEHLEISQVTIDFPTDDGPFRALEDVSLKIAKGEFVSLIGHSGCGKSTVLNIVAGLYQASSGGVILDGKEVNAPGPDRAVVFQNHSLLPWLTAYQHVELAVKQVFRGRKSRREMDEWIRHNLELVHMDHALHKRPDEISGGMKQGRSATATPASGTGGGPRLQPLPCGSGVLPARGPCATETNTTGRNQDPAGKDRAEDWLHAAH